MTAEKKAARKCRHSGDQRETGIRRRGKEFTTAFRHQSLAWHALIVPPTGAIFSLEVLMRNEFTAIIEKDGRWYVGYCPEVPGANGQGRTPEACGKSLSQAIALILDDRRKDALRGIPKEAIREVVVVR
jgi:predicted RNase H-like HicB family nuclease